MQLLKITGPPTPTFYEKTKKATKISKMEYNSFFQENPKVDSKYRYEWEHMLGREINDDEWQKNKKWTDVLTFVNET